MGDFGHASSNGPGFHIDYWGSGPFVLTVAGRSHRFEDSDRFGLTAISAKGEILARQWGERHPFWSAYAAWVQQGRQVEDDAQTCVWEPRSPTKVRRIGRTRHCVIVERGDDGAPVKIVEARDGRSA